LIALTFYNDNLNGKPIFEDSICAILFKMEERKEALNANDRKVLTG